MEAEWVCVRVMGGGGGVSGRGLLNQRTRRKVSRRVCWWGEKVGVQAGAGAAGDTERREPVCV